MNSTTMAHLDHSENSESEGQEFVFEEENISPQKSENEQNVVRQSVAASISSVISNSHENNPEVLGDLQVAHFDEKRPRLEISENQEESQNNSSTNISENHSSYEYYENTSDLVS